jgi:hypothetical protein
MDRQTTYRYPHIYYRSVTQSYDRSIRVLTMDGNEEYNDKQVKSLDAIEETLDGCNEHDDRIVHFKIEKPVST